MYIYRDGRDGLCADNGDVGAKDCGAGYADCGDTRYRAWNRCEGNYDWRVLMSRRVDILDMFYNEINEDARLNSSRQGQLEFLMTMNYIQRFAKDGAKLLEVLKSNSKGLENLQAFYRI